MRNQSEKVIERGKGKEERRNILRRIGLDFVQGAF